MSEAIAAKLDEARALIEKGWCKGSYRAGICYCTYGAVQQVIHHDATFEMDTPETRECWKYLGRATGRGALGIWNDAPERTHAEVIEAFRKAAELARGDLVDPLEQVRS